MARLRRMAVPSVAISMNWLKLSYIAGGSECKLVKQIWKIFKPYLEKCLMAEYMLNICISCQPCMYFCLFYLSFLSIYPYLFLSVYLSAIYLQNCKFTLITFNCSPTPQSFSSLQHSIFLHRSFSTVKELASTIFNTSTYLLSPSSGHHSLKYTANSVLVLWILTCGLLSWTQSYRTCWLSAPQSWLSPGPKELTGIPDPGPSFSLGKHTNGMPS